jgi:hypothetical protein
MPKREDVLVVVGMLVDPAIQPVNTRIKNAYYEKICIVDNKP